MNEQLNIILHLILHYKRKEEQQEKSGRGFVVRTGCECFARLSVVETYNVNKLCRFQIEERLITSAS